MKTEDIKARWSAATEGPWKSFADKDGSHWAVKLADSFLYPDFAVDAIAIAHAPEDIAHLLGRVEKLKKALSGRRCLGCGWPLDMALPSGGTCDVCAPTRAALENDDAGG